MAELILEDGSRIEVDKLGFLRDLDDWNEDVAEAMARLDAMRLTQKHWEVIRLLRSFYARHGVAPANRALVTLVGRELGADKGRSIYLMKLFGGSPAKLANKLAGLPKPDNCL